MLHNENKNTSAKETYLLKAKDKTKHIIEFLKLISNTTRFRLILLLLIFQKLSLSKLSQLVNRTKATVLHHLKKFEKLGFIIITKKEARRGYIDANVYELVPEFFDFFGKMSLNYNDIESLQLNKQVDILNYAMIKDILIFEVIRNIFKQVTLFYKGFDSINTISNSDSFKNYINFYLKNRIEYDILFLTRKEFKLYQEEVVKFKTQIRKIFKQNKKDDIETERPYFILNTFLPVKNITEYDPSIEEFEKFFESLS